MASQHPGPPRLRDPNNKFSHVFCSAKSTRTGEQCRNSALSNGRCRFHGGMIAKSKVVRALSATTHQIALEQLQDRLSAQENFTNNDLCRIADVAGKYGVGTKVTVKISSMQLLRIIGSVTARFLDPTQFDMWFEDCRKSLASIDSDTKEGDSISEVEPSATVRSLEGQAAFDEEFEPVSPEEIFEIALTSEEDDLVDIEGDDDDSEE